jgi:hypothetical protein
MAVEEEPVPPEVALAELECVANVLDKRVDEWKRRLEECEARRSLEGEEFRAQLAALKAECEARLAHQETIHAGRMAARDAEWEARLGAKVAELAGVVPSSIQDARVAAVASDYETRLMLKDAECRKQLAARDLEYVRAKDKLDAPKVQELKRKLRNDMDATLTQLKRELWDERELCARMRADLALSDGRNNLLEQEKMSGQWGAPRYDDSDDEHGLSMTRMTESARNTHLKQLLAKSAVTRQEAWLARDAEYDMVTALEKKLDAKELEMQIAVGNLEMDIKGLEFRLEHERQLRRRVGKGSIFHEDGKVLIKCTKCFEVRHLRDLFFCKCFEVRHLKDLFCKCFEVRHL